MIDKPAGLVVHPAPATPRPDPGRRAGRPARGRRGPGAAGDRPPPRQGHQRADVVARAERGAPPPLGAGEAREVERAYLALVRGQAGSRTGTIDAPIGPRPRAGAQMAVSGPRRERRAPISRSSSCSPRRPCSRRGWRPGAPTRSAPISPPSAIRSLGDAAYGGAASLRPRAPVPARAPARLRPSGHRRETEVLDPSCRPTSPGRWSWRGAPRARHAALLSRIPPRPITEPRRPTGPCPSDAGSRGGGTGSRTRGKGDNQMAEAGIKELLEAGVHFGHQTRRWNPHMRRYIFGERDGIHIIDLLQTEQLLDEARRFAGEVAGKRRHGALRRHQEAGARLGQGVGRPLSDALRQPALAGRAADQLQHDLGADQAPARAHGAAVGRPARAAADEGADGDARPSWRSSSTTSAGCATWSGCPTPSS